MTSLVYFLFMTGIVLLILRRRGRLFLESYEGYALGITFLLCVTQKIISGTTSLTEPIITPLYIAAIICMGHGYGASSGAVCGFCSATIISFASTAFTTSAGIEPVENYSSIIPFQHLTFMALWFITGALSGSKSIPKILKPFLSITWLVFILIYNPSFLRNLVAYIIMFESISLSSAGLYFNIFKARAIPSTTTPPLRQKESNKYL